MQIISVGLLYGTWCGLGTMGVYQRVSKILKKDPEAERKLQFGDMTYCGAVGAQMAIDDHRRRSVLNG